MNDRRHAGVVSGLLVLLLAGPGGAADPAHTCQGDKMLRAGLYDLCLLRATDGIRLARFSFTTT